MYSRRHGGKPTLALWTLIVLTDLAVLTKAGPSAVLLVVAGLVVLAAVGAAGLFWLQRTGGVTTGWPLHQRTAGHAQMRRRA
jgi:hypothetical protein